MKNPISTKPSRLATQISEAIPGVVKYSVILSLVAGLEALLTAQLAALELAINDHEQGKLAARNARNALRAIMKTCRVFVTMVREMAKPSVGGKYSQLWDAFGFNGSLVVPSNVDAMWELLGKMVGHLTDHPELANTDLNINAAQATLLRGQLLSAKTALNEKIAERQRLLEDRGVKVAAGRFTMRTLGSDLRLKLTPLDSRWVEFGFNKPGAQPTPDVPTGITTSMISPTAMLVKWPPVTRAQYYRLWKRVVGLDAELVGMGTTVELDFLLEVPANAQVEVALSAGNDGGESAPSTVVLVQTS